MHKTANKVAYLDGIRFKRAVIAGADRLISMQRHLDRINVFPVPDGDTGKNMAGTMKSVKEGAQASPEASIETMSRVMADAALVGARGNSGVILAQFLTGFADSVRNLSRVSPSEFARAAADAAASAYAAITRPQEGTILTVIHDWAEHMRQNARRYSDFTHLLTDSLTGARDSLAQTPAKLAALKKAGVVDAGAQGFVFMLEGMVEFLESGRLRRKVRPETVAEASVPEPVEDRDELGEARLQEEISFAFCTECLLSGTGIDMAALREDLAGLGDSLIVAGGGSAVRVHVHSDNPEQVFRIAENHGEITQRKVDDMRRQHREALGLSSQPTGIVVDSCCDLPAEIMARYDLLMAPLRLRLDDDEFVDKKDITPAEFYRRLPGTTSAQTSQPSPAVFTDVYAQALSRHTEVVSIHLPETLSGTLNTARNAASRIQAEIRVVDATTVSLGFGLVAYAAARAASLGLPAEDVADVARDAAGRVCLFAPLATTAHAVRGGRIPPSKARLAELLHLRPVISFDASGRAYLAAKGLGFAHARRKAFSLIRKRARGNERLLFALGHTGDPGAVSWYEERIRREFDPEVVMVCDISSVIGIYAGPGASAIAMLAYED